MNIQIEENETSGRAFVENLAEMTFLKDGNDVLTIDHTEVDEKLRGQGIARKMLDALIALAVERNLKINPVCSYVQNVFEKDESIRNVLVDN